MGLALAVVAVMVAAGGCGDDDDDDGGAAGGAVSTTTTAAKGSTTTTSTLVDLDTADLAAGPTFSDTGPSGAGCSPGNVTSLPEGWWAGTITEVDGTAVDFDLLCFYTGAPAEAAAKEDGREVDNDYYVRDNNHRTFRESFAAAAYATCVGEDMATFPCTVGDLLPLYPADGVGDHAPIGGRTAVAYPIVWVHVSRTTPDSLWVMFTP